MSEDQDIWGKLAKLVNIESKAGLEGLTALFIILLATIFTILFISPYEVIVKLPNYLLYPILFVIQEILTLFNNMLPGIPLAIFHIEDGIAPRLIFIIVILSLLLIARWRNNPKIGSLTGVWKQFSEINQLHKKWIDENIKSIEDLRNFGK